jgi:hypothetical protein
MALAAAADKLYALHNIYIRGFKAIINIYASMDIILLTILLNWHTFWTWMLLL